ncbi:PHB depolymerase family esterase [Rhizobium sp. BK491]|uniref:alpha/beta hydrolase family esterase n=1 Tax=Rhizobium sp. BK491 TaxID=2587009 RepID=UPI00160DCBEF|nr:PHB depolymerase family esterase [Rhizobium sp. BK491]MBB3571571.1 polyhydroxybutyrate depolymerase [Rhizobium sp. BK491]
MLQAFCRLTIVSLILMCSTSAYADETLTYTMQNTTRSAILHAPAATVGHAAPVVIALYGSGDSAAHFQTSIGFDAVADRENFVVVYPDAIDAHWNYGRPVRKMPLLNGQQVDDIGFVRTLIDDFVTRKLVDENRIYVTGFSRGAQLSFTLACALPDKIAAIAPVSGLMTEFQIDDCRPGHPMPIMMVNGTSDDTLLYDGFLSEDYRLLSVPETLEYWRRIDGCSGEDSKSLPRLNDHDRTRVTLFNWTGCKTGAGVRFYRIENGGHRWPRLVESGNDDPIKGARFGGRNGDIETAVEIWDFFKQYQHHQ